MGNRPKSMKYAALLLIGAAISAYIGVEGKPKALSANVKQRIDTYLDDIMDILTEERNETSRDASDLYPDDCKLAPGANFDYDDRIYCASNCCLSPDKPGGGCAPSKVGSGWPWCYLANQEGNEGITWWWYYCTNDC